MAAVIESVTRSAYMTTRPLTLRAARPMVWMSEDADRRNPSLSASRMATRATSGEVQPLPEEIDPHQDVEHSQSQLAQQFDGGHGVHVGVQVLDPHALLRDCLLY